MGFLDFYEAMDYEHTPEGKVDAFRRWAIKDRPGPEMELKAHKEYGNIANLQDKKKSNKNKVYVGLDAEVDADTEKPEDKEPEKTPKVKGSTLTEFNGKGGQGWWYLLVEPTVVEFLMNKFTQPKFTKLIEKVVPIYRNSFLVGNRYVFKPMPEDKDPNKYKSICLALDKVNKRKEDRDPDFGFVIFDGIESLRYANEYLWKDIVGKILKSDDMKRLLKPGQVAPSQVTNNPVLYHSFKDIPMDKIPKEHFDTITDMLQELADELKDNATPKAAPKAAPKGKGKPPITSSYKYDINGGKLSFLEFYDMTKSDIEMKMFEASGYLVNDLVSYLGPKVFKGAMGLLRGSKTKNIAIQNAGELDKYVDPNKLFVTTFNAYGATVAACSESLVQYYNKDLSAVDRMLLTKEKVMVNKKFNILIPKVMNNDENSNEEEPESGMSNNEPTNTEETPNEVKTEAFGFKKDPNKEAFDDFVKRFDFGDNFEVKEIFAYETTNKGYVFLMTVMDEGENEKIGVNMPKKANAKNIKFFVGATVKGEQFFLDNYNKSLIQWLMYNKQANPEQIKKNVAELDASVKATLNGTDTGNMAEPVEVMKKENITDVDFKTITDNFTNIMTQKNALAKQPKDSVSSTGIKSKEYTLKNKGKVSFATNPHTGKNSVVLTKPAYDFFKDNNIDDVTKYKPATA